MNIEYRIVDMDGDEIQTNFIHPGHELPCKMRSVEISEDGSTMTITVEYLHGKRNTQKVANEFPFPFGGVKNNVAINPNWLEDVLIHITTRKCLQGHMHNFAVEMNQPWPVIYGTATLMSCISAYVDGRRGRIG